jgi:hypothetical protein
MANNTSNGDATNNDVANGDETNNNVINNNAKNGNATLQIARDLQQWQTITPQTRHYNLPGSSATMASGNAINTTLQITWSSTMMACKRIFCFPSSFYLMLHLAL